LEPVLDGFAFKRFIEFTADFYGDCVHGLMGSLFTQFSVRQIGATSARLDLPDGRSQNQDLPMAISSPGGRG
ncbi:MAG TPA: hypothetical protein VJT54_07365, partial [Verrucomicrobiae bacterium]|nr:hypothetical protein [Verrucomicrobiae bacterium]